MQDIIDTELLAYIADNFFVYGTSLLFTLFIVVSLHEAGHYFAARLCGVRVEKFAFGFGHELFGFGGKNGNTRWSFCVIPLGGYIKIFGDVDPNNPQIYDKSMGRARPMRDYERLEAYYSKTVWQRMFIVFAGPLANLCLTVLIFVSVFTFYGERSKPVYINSILVGSNADKAGIEIGDQIISMDGERIRRLEDIYAKTWHEKPPRDHTYQIMRNGQELEITFAARYVVYEATNGVPMSHGQTGMSRIYGVELEDIIGVNGVHYDHVDDVRQQIIQNFDQIVEIKAPFNGAADMDLPDSFRVVFSSQNNEHLLNPEDDSFNQAFVASSTERYYVKLGFMEAFASSFDKMKAGLVGTYQLLRATILGKNDSRMIAGVGKLSSHTGEAYQAGLYEFFMAIAVFSYMIAIVNLLPIPGLDGGHLLFLTIEKIIGRPVSQKIQSITLLMGLAFLWGIMIFANIGDVLLLLNY